MHVTDTFSVVRVSITWCGTKFIFDDGLLDPKPSLVRSEVHLVEGGGIETCATRFSALLPEVETTLKVRDVAPLISPGIIVVLVRLPSPHLAFHQIGGGEDTTEPESLLCCR